MVQPISVLLEAIVPFKLTKEKCQKGLDHVKQTITSSPLLVYSDPGTQYYLLTDSSKHKVLNTLFMKKTNYVFMEWNSHKIS